MKNETNYIIIVNSYAVDREGYPQEGTWNKEDVIYHGVTNEGLQEHVNEIVNNWDEKKEAGIEFEIAAWTARTNEDYYEDTDQDDILEYLEQEDYLFSEYVRPLTKSLDGAIIIEWSWQQHVGYARECNCIFKGSSTDNPLMLIEEDHCYRPQYTVLAYPNELTGNDEKDYLYCLAEATKNHDWRWRNPSLIEEELSKIFVF